MMKRLALLMLSLIIALPALAQNGGGQFWVQAFEDRDGSGTRDAGEPFLTRGVSVDLLNADGVVIASGTLDDAQYANQGFIGFTYLVPGNYVALITAPGLTATTPERVPVTISAGDTTPITVPFGAQRAAATETGTSSGGAAAFSINSETARLALAGFGALIVVGIMAAIGLLIYALVLRRRAPIDKRITTANLRPVRFDETGEIRRTREIRRP